MWAWELWRSEKYLGKLVENDRDFPWVICDFESTPEFEAGYRALFDGDSLFDDDAGEAIYLLNLKYRPLNSSTPKIEMALIHINGDRADLRPIFAEGNKKEGKT